MLAEADGSRTKNRLRRGEIKKRPPLQARTARWDAIHTGGGGWTKGLPAEDPPRKTRRAAYVAMAAFGVRFLAISLDVCCS